MSRLMKSLADLGLMMDMSYTRLEIVMPNWLACESGVCQFLLRRLFSCEDYSAMGLVTGYVSRFDRS